MRLAKDHKDVTAKGPADASEVQWWGKHIVKQLCEYGLEPTWFEGKTIWVTCLWAGLGGMPIGMNYLADAISEFEKIPDMELKYWSFSDSDLVCQGNR